LALFCCSDEVPREVSGDTASDSEGDQTLEPEPDAADVSDIGESDPDLVEELVPQPDFEEEIVENLDGADDRADSPVESDLLSDPDLAPDPDRDPVSDTADADRDTAEPVTCPSVRPDLGASYRAAPEVQRFGAAGDALLATRIEFDSSGENAYLATTSGLYSADMGDPAWRPFGADVEGRFDSLLVADGLLYAGRDLEESPSIRILSLAGDLLRTESMGQPIIWLRADPWDQSVLLAGGRWGNVYRSTTEFVSHEDLGGSGGSHLAGFLFASDSDVVIVSTGASGQYFESDDRGRSFSLRTNADQEAFAGGFANWRSSEQAILFAGTNHEPEIDEMIAVYQCDLPCTEPVILEGSEQMRGRLVETPVVEGTMGLHMAVHERGLIAAASDRELWFSADDGETFQMVVNLFECRAGTIHEIQFHDSHLYLATSNGPLRIALTELGIDPVCPNVRTDITAEYRRTVEIEDLGDSDTDAVHTLQIEFSDTHAFIGTTDGLYRSTLESPVDWRLFTGAVVGQIDALLVTLETVYAGEDLDTNRIVTSLDHDASVQFRAEVSGRVTGLYSDPSDDSSVFVGSGDGSIWRTGDSGENWTLVKVATGGHISNIHFDDDSDNAVAGSGNIGVYFDSDDRGLTWARVVRDGHAFWPGSFVNWGDDDQALLIAASDPGPNAYGRIYTCDFPCTGPAGLSNTVRIEGLVPHRPGSRLLGSLLDLHSSGLIATASMFELWVSSDNGASFQMITNLFDCDRESIYEIQFEGDYLYLATSEGPYRIAVSEFD
jgi:hypothetical protein